MSDIISSVIILFVPLTLAFTLLCAIFAASAVVGETIDRVKVRQAILHSAIINKAYEGNHRKGGDRRQRIDRREHQHDRRHLMAA